MREGQRWGLDMNALVGSVQGRLVSTDHSGMLQGSDNLVQCLRVPLN